MGIKSRLESHFKVFVFVEYRSKIAEMVINF